MARGSIAPPVRTRSKEELWASEAAIEIGRNSYAPPVELPAVSHDQDKKKANEFIDLHMAR
jgi:hypothetical protein